MHKGIVAYVAIIIIIIALWYFTVGFRFPSSTRTTTTVTNSITNSTSNQITTTSTTTIPIYNIPCNEFGLFNRTAFNTTFAATCEWTGGLLGFWVGSGDAQYEHASITGANGIIYVNQSSQYSCPILFTNFTAPQDNLTLRLYVGPQSTSATKCDEAFAKLNDTTVAPKNETYTQVFNGNFSSGTYTGWTYSGKGFNFTPMGVAWADKYNCTLGSPWSNTNFSYFATTYSCGTTIGPGNLTSSLFIASKPYLNFRVISGQNNNLYVAILNQTNYTVITFHFNTFTNTSAGYSTFRNASIPLTTVFNKPIRIKVVSTPFGKTLKSTYIAVSGFGLAGAPHEDKGIVANESFNTT